MTLEETIERYTSNAEYERTHGNLQGCLEFKQLAKWLKDYKQLLEQEPCEDAISRQAVFDLCGTNRYDLPYNTGVRRGYDEGRIINMTKLKLLPSVTIPSAEQETGCWIWQTEDIYKCSKCGEEIHVKEVMNVPQYKWCPMCGNRLYAKV